MGVRYQSANNTYEVVVEKKEQDPEILIKPREIYCIYFLAYGIDLPKRPVLKVNYKVEDAHSGEELPATGEFVTSLHHRSWIVQINELKKNRRNTLEKILSVFDQSAITDNRHIIDVDEDNFPEEYKEIIRRLRKAKEDPNKRLAMEIEDDIIDELKDKERKIAALQADNKALQTDNEALQTDNEAKTKALEAKTKALEEQAKELAKMKEIIKNAGIEQ